MRSRLMLLTMALHVGVRAVALVLGIIAFLMTTSARASPAAATVISNTQVLSAVATPRPQFFQRLRVPPVRADARRLRAPARAQAKPSTPGPCIERHRWGAGIYYELDTLGNVRRVHQSQERQIGVGMIPRFKSPYTST